MDAEAIFEALRVIGATLRVRGDALEVSAPRGLSRELREAIAAQKPALVTRLRKGGIRQSAEIGDFRVTAAEAFLAELERSGVSVTVAEITADDVRLSVRTARALPDALGEAIRRHKPLLAEILLRRRAEKGSDVLWEMERAGTAETAEYERLFRVWTDLRCGYEVLSARNQAACAEEAA